MSAHLTGQSLLPDIRNWLWRSSDIRLLVGVWEPAGRGVVVLAAGQAQ